MPAKPKDTSKDVTEKCPQCGGEGTVPGRYTEAGPVLCPTCDGDGNVPKHEKVEAVEEPDGDAAGE